MPSDIGLCVSRLKKTYSQSFNTVCHTSYIFTPIVNSFFTDNIHYEVQYHTHVIINRFTIHEIVNLGCNRVINHFSSALDSRRCENELYYMKYHNIGQDYELILRRKYDCVQHSSSADNVSSVTS